MIKNCNENAVKPPTARTGQIPQRALRFSYELSAL